MTHTTILRDALQAAKIGLRDWEVPANRYKALDAINAALAAADADQARDAGPWRYQTNFGAEFACRYFVESDDSTHDVRLYINGDFADDAQREQYGRALAETLNAAPTVLADEFTDDMYGAWDGIDNSLQRAEMEKIYRAVRVAARPAPDGWQMVPKVPTEEMHAAAVRTLTRCVGNDDFPPKVFRAMLAAAPAAPIGGSTIPRMAEFKTDDLVRRGYRKVGYILAREDGKEYALSDSSVRWLSQPQYWRLMHEQDGSLFAEHAKPEPTQQERHDDGVAKLMASADRGKPEPVGISASQYATQADYRAAVEQVEGAEGASLRGDLDSLITNAIVNGLNAKWAREIQTRVTAAMVKQAGAVEECTLCNGMGMLDGIGSTCPHCDGSGEERQAGAVDGLSPDDVEWVTNDNAELGVKIRDQFFFLYKGDSLVYKDGLHDDGTPMHWRHVWKREFGECAHPVNYSDPTKWGTVSLSDSDEWQVLPAASANQKGEG